MTLRGTFFVVVSAAVVCISCRVFAGSLSGFVEVSSSTLGAELEGCYVNSSYLCTDPNDGRVCSKKFNDYLSVKDNFSGYKVDLYSTQAGQNVCAFSMDMKLVDGALVRETSAGIVSLTRKGGVLRIDSPGVDPTALGIGVCGVHADIDGLEFPVSGKSSTFDECSSKFNSVKGGAL